MEGRLFRRRPRPFPPLTRASSADPIFFFATSSCLGSEKTTTHPQLPNPQANLERIALLVRLGGWLLIEEVSLDGEVKGDANAVRLALDLACKYGESNGQVLAIGSKLESWVQETGAFSQVNVHKVIAPAGNNPEAAAGTHVPFHHRTEACSTMDGRHQTWTASVDVQGHLA